MPNFQVDGTDATTRIKRTEIVQADNAQEATAVAEARGVRVEAVIRLRDPNDPAMNQLASGFGGAGGAGPATAPSGVSPGVAALCSFFIPGLGQMLTNRVGAGVAWLILVYFTYIVTICLFALPGLILHLICIIDAAKVPTFGSSQSQPRPQPHAQASPRMTQQPADDGSDQTVL